MPPNTSTFLLKLQFDNEKGPGTMTEITYPSYEYLSGSKFAVNVAPLNKEFANVKPLSKENGHNFIPNST